MQHSHSTHKQKHGFSLIELLVVMAIIAILMGLVVGVSGAVTRKAAEARARAEISDLMMEIEFYKSDKGSYPNNWTEFGAWYDIKYTGTLYTITDGPGPENPVDPWGKAYRLSDVAQFTYVIGSQGPNGKNGGNGKNNFGDDDDITNRNGAL